MHDFGSITTYKSTSITARSMINGDRGTVLVDGHSRNCGSISAIWSACVQHNNPAAQTHTLAVLQLSYAQPPRQFTVKFPPFASDVSTQHDGAQRVAPLFPGQRPRCHTSHRLGWSGGRGVLRVTPLCLDGFPILLRPRPKAKRRHAHLGKKGRAQYEMLMFEERH